MGQTVDVIPADVRSRYDAGVEALARSTSGFTSAQWAAPACGGWNGEQLAGHVVGVIGWYHDWLDRALEGDASAPFDPDEMDSQNDHTLESMTPEGGSNRIEHFVDEAHRYAERVDGVEWKLPYGYPRGTVTVGRHFGGAATVEWHVHAWDMSGGAHRPADASGLFLDAADLHLSAGRSFVAGVQRRLAPLAAKRDPWRQMLRATGRKP